MRIPGGPFSFAFIFSMVYVHVEMAHLYFLAYHLQSKWQNIQLIPCWASMCLYSWKPLTSHETGNCLQWGGKSRAESLASFLGPRG